MRYNEACAWSCAFGREELPAAIGCQTCDGAKVCGAGEYLPSAECVYDNVPAEKCEPCLDGMSLQINASALAEFTPAGNAVLDDQLCSFSCVVESPHSRLISVANGFPIAGGPFAGAKTYFSDSSDTLCAWTCVQGFVRRARPQDPVRTFTNGECVACDTAICDPGFWMPGAVVGPSCGATVEGANSRIGPEISSGLFLESSESIATEYGMLAVAKREMCVACSPKPADAVWTGPGSLSLSLSFPFPCCVSLSKTIKR